MTLAADFMFFNVNLFTIMSTRKLELVTFKHISSWTGVHLSKILNKLIKLYIGVSFIIHVIIMDVYFKKVVDKLVKVEVDIAVSRDHVREVESKIRIFK